MTAKRSRRFEHDREHLGRPLAVLKAICNDSERQGLYAREGVLARIRVGHHAWQLGDLANPATVSFLLELDVKIHAGLR
jgi:hypothetical protein